jgi:hypothetical protein
MSRGIEPIVHPLLTMISIALGLAIIEIDSLMMVLIDKRKLNGFLFYGDEQE